MKKHRVLSQPPGLRHTIDNQQESMPFSNMELLLLRKVPLLSVKKVSNDRQFLKKRAQSIPILQGIRLETIVTPTKNSTYSIHVAERAMQTSQRSRKDHKGHQKHQPLDKKMLGFQALIGTPLLRRMIERETMDMAYTCYSARSEGLEVAGASKQISPMKTTHPHSRRASMNNFFPLP